MAAEADYRALLQQVMHWAQGEVLPACPLCAGVAFYQGGGFTRDDIPTGWQSFLLCHSGKRHPLVSTLLANMGVAEHLAPRVLVQLRPMEEEEEEAELVDGFSSLWRGKRSSMAQNLISASLPCGERLLIEGRAVKDLGIQAFFCEQVNKTACTSRTRVGRYLDDQPARAPRSHVYGLAKGMVTVPTVEAEEVCPFCRALGCLIKPESVSLLPWEVELGMPSEQGAAGAFHGLLWFCGRHLWGWRSRRCGVPVTME